MKHILVIGAGRSSSYLIDYLINHSETENWFVTVADMDEKLAYSRTKGRPKSACISFNVFNEAQRRDEISKADLVISMLPASMHGDVAKDCLQLNKHLATASYVSAEMRELHNEAKQKKLIFMNEVGLDPGIDHASAMKIIDEVHEQGGKIKIFKSYCGGLVAPESNDNPWGYKFSWNPRNVVVAGQSTALFRLQGKQSFIPPSRIFSQIEKVNIDSCGSFDGYANRDSLSYIEPYGLSGIDTILRGTLRHNNFCEAWDILVKLGLTDDAVKIPGSEKMTMKEITHAFLPSGSGSLRERLDFLLQRKMSNEIWMMIDYLELEGNHICTIPNASAAQVLQSLLEKKWLLKSDDKDMIVMQHQFVYELKGQLVRRNSSLVVVGDDNQYTAMAKTVGLPLAIASKLILQNKIPEFGVIIPVKSYLYQPLLKELETFNIIFNESTV